MKRWCPLIVFYKLQVKMCCLKSLLYLPSMHCVIFFAVYLFLLYFTVTTGICPTHFYFVLYTHSNYTGSISEIGCLICTGAFIVKTDWKIMVLLCLTSSSALSSFFFFFKLSNAIFCGLLIREKLQESTIWIKVSKREKRKQDAGQSHVYSLPGALYKTGREKNETKWYKM